MSRQRSTEPGPTKSFALHSYSLDRISTGQPRSRGDTMKLRNLLLTTAGLTLALGMAGAVLAQSNGPAPGGRIRHLLFIATPGGGGADDQSGIVVLDADHDYRFVK